MHFVYFGQALDLLRASLTSNEAALTKSLFCLLWICQRCIPFPCVLGSRHRMKKEKEEEEKVILSNKRHDKREKDKREIEKRETDKKEIDKEEMK